MSKNYLYTHTILHERQGKICAFHELTTSHINHQTYVHRFLRPAVKASNCGWHDLQYLCIKYPNNDHLYPYMVLYVNDRPERWIPVDGKARDCDAKYALSFDSEGMYVEAVVTDSEHFVEATKGDEIVQNDGIRFAIDSYGRLRNTERSEFFVGIVNGKPSVYKYYAADLSEAVVEGWSPSGTMLKDGYADIQRDSDKGVTTYKVYIPYSEIYPFMFVGDNEVRFALAISDNDGGVQKGYLSFGEGIASELPQVWKYIRMQLSL